MLRSLLLLQAGSRISKHAGSTFSRFQALSKVSTRKISSGLFHSDEEPAYAGTIAELKIEIMHRLGLEPGYQPIKKSREHLLEYHPTAESLPPRSMKDSYSLAILPLSADTTLQDKYVSHLGQVRPGRLMEDMDMFAVWVCHQHISMTLPENVHLPYTFVTVLVDKIEVSDVLTKADEDIHISGHVSWVGNTTMEIILLLEQMENGVKKEITSAVFLMAARNATNTGPAPVNKLVPANEKEEEVLAGGEQRKKIRLELQASSVFKIQPNEYEQSLMYEIFKRTTDTNTMELNKRILPGNCRWMSESFAMTTMPSFPENRNAQYTVFGGFLMRCAVEVSSMSAYLYAKSRPRMKGICDISFEKPVSVTSFIKMTAYVIYTEANYMSIITLADILDANTGQQVTSNVFHLTYSVREEVPEVLPRSYQETLWHIQGRRKFMYLMGLQ